MRACDAMMQGAPAESGDPQGERSGPVIDRWEPGSDFESSKPTQRAGKRKLNGVDSSAPAGRPATPQPVHSSGVSPVAATGNAIGPARSDRSLDRSEPASLLLLVLCCCALQGGAGAERQARFEGGGLWRALSLVIDIREAISVLSKLSGQAKGRSCWHSIRKEEHSVRDVLQQIRIRALTCSLAPSRGWLKML